MKYIILKTSYIENKKNPLGDIIQKYITTDDLQTVFAYLKDKQFRAYRLGGEILSMEDAVKKEV